MAKIKVSRLRGNETHKISYITISKSCKTVEQLGKIDEISD